MSKSKKTKAQLKTQLKGKILSALRRMTWSWQPINDAQNKTKVAPATFCCTKCRKWCYTGKSQKSLITLQEKHPDEDIVMETIYRDHIDPVIEIKKDYVWSWDEVIDRMFCEEDNVQILCSFCHKTKTLEETQQRKELRK